MRYMVRLFLRKVVFPIIHKNSQYGNLPIFSLQVYLSDHEEAESRQQSHPHLSEQRDRAKMGQAYES
jgi:hypothetical protein